jgi:prepilin-type N-terminal cleavage/methylation domain-containing protein
MQAHRSSHGFTIVELLIVIVVIAILAAISIVAYNGIQVRAKDSAVQSLIVNNAKKVHAYKTIAGQYPTPDELINNRAPGSTVNNSGPSEARLEGGGVASSGVTSSNGDKLIRYVRQADGLCAWFDWWDFNNNRLTTLSTTPRSYRIDC